MKLPLGLIQWTEGTDGEKLVEYVRRLESLGYEERWLPVIAGREPFSTAGYLLAKTDKIKISSGIANVYARDADASAQAANTLNEFSNGHMTKLCCLNKMSIFQSVFEGACTKYCNLP